MYKSESILLSEGVGLYGPGSVFIENNCIIQEFHWRQYGWMPCVFKCVLDTCGYSGFNVVQVENTSLMHS